GPRRSPIRSGPASCRSSVRRASAPDGVRYARAPMAFSPATARTRAGQALRRPHNWVQLAKFSAVGLSGYVINLAVYTALLKGAGFHYAAAATCSFLVAVTNNYT